MAKVRIYPFRTRKVWRQKSRQLGEKNLEITCSRCYFRQDTQQNMSRKLTGKIIDQFTFTRRDQVSILVLVILIILSFFIPALLRSSDTSSIPLSTLDSLWISTPITFSDSQVNLAFQDSELPLQRHYSNAKPIRVDRPVPELFYFDPNTLSQAGWKKLGLRDRTIATITNYLSKGGRFNKAEDLSRIYGLFEDEYTRLKPYIRFEHPAASNPVKAFDSKASNVRINQIKIVDINRADTLAFIALPGIGSKLAARILQFREKLGGFYSIDQLAETYGLRDSTFQNIRQYLVLEDPVLRKININKASIDDLKVHPYIRYNLAAPIVAYRNEHGPFEVLEDIKNVMAVTDEIYNKLLPYLEL
jgi:competence protein ComEA